MASHVGRLALHLADRTITMPDTCGAAVAPALSGEPVRVGAFPGLDDADGVVLARRLLREAIVVAVGATD